MYMTIVDVRGPSAFGPFPNRISLQRFADYWGYRQFRVLKDRPNPATYRDVWKPTMGANRFHSGMDERPEMRLERSVPAPRGYVGPFSHPLINR